MVSGVNLRLTSIVDLVFDGVVLHVLVEFREDFHGPGGREFEGSPGSDHGLGAHRIHVIDAGNHGVHIGVFVPKSVQIELVLVFLLLGHLSEVVGGFLAHGLLVQKRLLINVLLLLCFLGLLSCYLGLGAQGRLLFLPLLLSYQIIPLVIELLGLLKDLVCLHESVICLGCLLSPLSRVLILISQELLPLFLFLHQSLCHLHIFR